MSTLEDFKNAPFGSTATQEETRARAFRLHREFGETWVVAEPDGTFDTFESEELVDGGFILDPSPSRPTTAREALALAWDLAHPVKEGQVIPADTDYLMPTSGGRPATMRTSFEWRASKTNEVTLRTLDPLPDPEPDWLDAPAVLAWSRWDDVRREKVWSKADECYENTDGETIDWQDLRDVTPLYPKGQDQ